MKNIHVLPTDKPSELLNWKNDFLLTKDTTEFNKLFWKPVNIYITSDEKIKKGDWFLHIKSSAIGQHNGAEILLFKDDRKIILTTDQDLIKDCVQAIDDEFLEWFVNNSSCESIEVKDNREISNEFVELDTMPYEIIIPKEEAKQETLEEAAENFAKSISNIKPFYRENTKKTFINGAKWQAERMYSEEEVLELIKQRDLHNIIHLGGNRTHINREEWFEQFKKK